MLRVNQQASTQQGEFDSLRINLAGPDKIRSWSFGEVKKPETINYRTFKPERDGLFCAKIFGPTNDYECLCGKYKRIKYRGIVCEKCDVEVTTNKVRRERMGHIDLAAPVTHIWFLKSLPSRISLLLDMPIKELERVLYFESYIVLDPQLSALSYRDLLNEEKYQEARSQYGPNGFVAMIGAEAILEMLKAIDLEKLQERIRADIVKCNSEVNRKKMLRRLKLVEHFIASGNKPEWMVVQVLPVLPPDIRPLIMLEAGRFAASDLNELYRRVINRNNRLRRLLALKAPDIIIRNEKRMLQESVDALFDNGRRGRVVKNNNKRAFKSLSDMLKGKYGRFRQNLLGKRVDYSGRSVIVVGPELRLYQCGLPKTMALELFKPFIYSKLERYGFATTLKSAKKIVEMERPEVWDILEEVIREHPVLLNRAPTLHRLSIQAFEPVLIEGKAIQLHPLVCEAFNADFDGDQMAVHVPLSIEAQMEARVLMMSTNNILSPANGRPIIVPSKDTVAGLYYLTLEVPGEKGEGRVFGDIQEVKLAHFNDELTLHSRIKCRVAFKHGGESEERMVDTTLGRLILFDLCQSLDVALGFDVVNKHLTRKDVGSIVNDVYELCGAKQTAIFCDRLMGLGFDYACKSGLSLGKSDLIVPQTKNGVVKTAAEQVALFERQYQEGLITESERSNKVIDTWSRCTEVVAEDMIKNISSPKFSQFDSNKQRGVNSLYMMAHSGARGSTQQIKQLMGMKGLIVKPSGQIMERPIISSYIEGFSGLEYFSSTHGSRKGLSDTALKTANSGYLTRRLVDVAQECVIRELDCQSNAGLVAKSTIDNGEISVPLSESIFGRVSVSDIRHPLTQEVIVKAGEMIDSGKVKAIELAGIDSMMIRSVLTCRAEEGVCARCYGMDLASGKMVSVGEAVGVIAAQSIGEPGTQLTLRTFHVGGAASKSVEVSNVHAPQDCVAKFSTKSFVVDKSNRSIVMSRSCEVVFIRPNGQECAKHSIPYGATVHVQDGQSVKKGQLISDWDPYTTPIVTEKNGRVVYKDVVEGVSLKNIVDEDTGIAHKTIVDWRQKSKGADLRPRLVLEDEDGEMVVLSNNLEARYFMPAEAVLNVEDGEMVSAGDVLARIPRKSGKSKDITGGLPRVVELFEARKPKDHAIISELDGVVYFGLDYKSKRRLIVKSRDEAIEPVEYLIPKGKHIAVNEGDEVKKGDLLMDGHPVLQDILRVMGLEELARYVTSEIQQVYRLQGVKINDKHIEVILKYMLNKVEIESSGETSILEGEQMDRREFEEENRVAQAEGRRGAEASMVLQGITKASLQTRSFISAASFQETIKVLIEASIAGKVDKLNGLKENVIVGKVIPAGTGLYMRSLQGKHDLERKDEERSSGVVEAHDNDLDQAS